MEQEQLTLYKLMILYLIEKVDFPLSNSQISEFILDKGYTNYFTVQRAFHELEEENMLRVKQIRNMSHYALSDEGLEAIEMFEYQIPKSIKENVAHLLKEKSKELNINFIGNVEGRDAFSGKIDAIVTDGFTGNVFLKTTEGLGKFVKKSLVESFTANIFSKISYLIAHKPIKSLSKAMDYKSYGGALFLGVKKPVVKAHGSSDALLFEYTIIQAEKFVENKAVDHMIEEFEKQRQQQA